MIKQLRAQGSPFECGRQVGQAFRAEITGRIPNWARWPKDPIQKEKYQRLMDKSCAYLEAELPEVMEEMRGIAQGTGLSLGDVYLLNAANSLSPAMPYAACSSLGFLKTEVGPILGKTDDGGSAPTPEAAIQARLETLLALTVRPTKGHAILGVGPMGMLWAECGVNEKGLCIGTSSGHPERSRPDGKGIPQHLIPRLVLLHCADVPEALDFLRRYDTMGKGINIVLVDEKGNGAAVETTYTLHGVRAPKNHVIFATNHYFAPEMQVFTAQTNPDYISTRYFQNSVDRVANLAARFWPEQKELSFQLLKETMMDHHKPGGLCQHGPENDAAFQTNFCALFVSAKREMWLNEGSPCRDRFEKYTLI